MSGAEGSQTKVCRGTERVRVRVGRRNSRGLRESFEEASSWLDAGLAALSLSLLSSGLLPVTQNVGNSHPPARPRPKLNHKHACGSWCAEPCPAPLIAGPTACKCKRVTPW